jgi:hypothetical protein
MRCMLRNPANFRACSARTSAWCRAAPSTTGSKADHRAQGCDRAGNVTARLGPRLPGLDAIGTWHFSSSWSAKADHRAYVRRDSRPPGLLLIAGSVITACEPAELPLRGRSGSRTMESITLKLRKKNEVMVEVAIGSDNRLVVSGKRPGEGLVGGGDGREGVIPLKSSVPGHRPQR